MCVGRVSMRGPNVGAAFTMNVLNESAAYFIANKLQPTYDGAFIHFFAYKRKCWKSHGLHACA